MLELDRLAALRSLELLDTPPEERFDRIARLAAALYDVPIALISLMDADRQWHKACVGPMDPETPRALTFCTVTIRSDDPLVIPDTLEDAHFATHPLVVGEPHIRFYAGHPLATVDGFRVGTICLVDHEPRRFDEADVARLRDLARIAETELNQRELSEALAAWRQSEQRFRAVFHAAGAGIVLVDRGGRYVDVNEAFATMLGRTVSELRGAAVADVTHPADREADDAAYARLYEQGSEGFRREKRYVRADGAVVWGGVTGSLLRGADGRADMAIAVVEDVTERKALDRIKDELVSVVGHELRTPLTSIRGSLGLLEAGLAGALPAEAAQMVAIACENTDRLVRLVNDTLDLERLQAGRVEVDPRPVAPAGLLATAAQVVQPVADAAGVELRFETDGEELMVDADRIVQALVNLIGNAVKFSPAGTCVRTSVVRDGDHALVTVSDQGRGIPPDQLEAVFERFRQVDASDRREKGGTGLGLPISRAIVEQHAGRIWAESPPGEGATFRFTVPLSRAAVAVYDRRQGPREELARAVRRQGLVAVQFDSPEALAAAAVPFTAVLTAHAEGLEDVTLPVIEVGEADAVAELLERLR